MPIDAYTSRHTRRDVHPWLRLCTPVGALGLVVWLAGACGDDRATNPSTPAGPTLFSVEIAANAIQRRAFLGVGEQ